MFSNVFQCYLLSFSLSLSLSLSHSFNLSLNHSWHAEQLLFSSLCSKLTLTISHSLSISHSHSYSLSHSFNISCTHSWHAEQVLFSSLCSKVAVYRRKLQWFFFDSSLSTTLTCEFWVHRAGSQLKTLSFSTIRHDIKTNVVQHVESDWTRDWKSVRVRKRVRKSERLR